MYTITYATSADRHSAQHMNVKVTAMGLAPRIVRLQANGNVIVRVTQIG